MRKRETLGRLLLLTGEENAVTRWNRIATELMVDPGPIVIPVVPWPVQEGPITEPVYAFDLNILKSFGSLDSTTRTADQTEIEEP
jgi:hypothetical protein